MSPTVLLVDFDTRTPERDWNKGLDRAHLFVSLSVAPILVKLFSRLPGKCSFLPLAFKMLFFIFMSLCFTVGTLCVKFAHFCLSVSGTSRIGLRGRGGSPVRRTYSASGPSYS